MNVRCFRFVLRRPSVARAGGFTVRLYSSVTTLEKASEPLRILFCGSDLFSISSLNALNRERQKNPQLIESIDVLVRPGKLVGRNLKTVQEVPLKSVAGDLGLRIHERDTFTGWEVPPAGGGAINLIIAVSFGLFVPPRVLKGAKYGGLNVHPSLLPNYRGPAPLQHIIMQGDKAIGVTLQTMDDKSFDHGQILSQEELPLPFAETPTYGQLLSFIRPVAADLLTQGLRDRVFVPPFPEVEVKQPAELVHAGKITSADREAVWGETSSVDLERRFRALGRLWADICDPTHQSMHRRAIFEDCELVRTPASLTQWMSGVATDTPSSIPRGIHDDVRTFSQKRAGSDTTDLLLYTIAEDGEAIIVPSRLTPDLSLRVNEITLAGHAKQPAAKAMRAIEGTKGRATVKAPDKRMARPT